MPVSTLTLAVAAVAAVAVATLVAGAGRVAGSPRTPVPGPQGRDGSAGDRPRGAVQCQHCGTTNGPTQVHCRSCRRTVAPLAWHHER